MILELPIPVSKIWDLLWDFPSGSYKDIPWARCLSRARGMNLIGEVHLNGYAQTDDFKDVPIGRRMRVVMMLQGEGFIMRWGDSENSDGMKQILGGIYHADLLRWGDNFEAVRSAWITIPKAGYLEILDARTIE